MFVFIDTETGGLSPDYSLLTVAAAVTDKDFNILDTLSFSLRPNDGYVVSPEAMQVNKIDLAKHAEIAIYSDSARLKLAHLLANALTQTGLRRLVPAGHNVGFDLGFIYSQVMPESDFRKYCTYPALDTAAVARFLANAGLIKTPCNLVSLREQFGIETAGAHNAEADVFATIKIAKLFTSFLKGVPTA